MVTRAVRILAVLGIVLIIAGCGARIVSPSGVERISRNLGNLKSLSDARVTPSKESQDSAQRIAADIAACMDISEEDLRSLTTVPYQDWNTDAPAASRKVIQETSQPASISNGWLATAGVAGMIAMSIAAIALRTIAASGVGPVSNIAGILGALLGVLENNKNRIIKDKIISAVDVASEVDPEYIHNPVFKQLSATMSTDEKTHIKNRKAKARYGKAKEV